KALEKEVDSLQTRLGPDTSAFDALDQSLFVRPPATVRPPPTARPPSTSPLSLERLDLKAKDLELSQYRKTIAQILHNEPDHNLRVYSIGEVKKRNFDDMVRSKVAESYRPWDQLPVTNPDFFSFGMACDLHVLEREDLKRSFRNFFSCMA